MTSGWEEGPAWEGILAVGRVDSGAVYYVGLAVVVAIMIGSIIAFYRTWAEIHEDLEPDTPQDLLDSFREAHAAGEIDDRELERVRNLLSAGLADAAATASPRPTRGPNRQEESGPLPRETNPTEPDPAEPIQG